jgi:ribosome-binding protein aMBF1 (putative translation factor)
MSVKLTDREISALARKIADKKRKEASARLATVTKTKLPQAKKLLDSLKSMPDEVISFLDDTRYSKHERTPAKLAEKLARKEEVLERIEDKTFEPDVVLAAHSCSSMGQLCNKLGI